MVEHEQILDCWSSCVRSTGSCASRAGEPDRAARPRRCWCATSPTRSRIRSAAACGGRAACSNASCRTAPEDHPHHHPTRPTACAASSIIFGPMHPPARQAVNLHEVLERVRAGGRRARQLYAGSCATTIRASRRCRGDCSALVQAVLGIVRNAPRRALAGTGTITLRTRVTPVHDRLAPYKLVARLDIVGGPGIRRRSGTHLLPMITTAAPAAPGSACPSPGTGEPARQPDQCNNVPGDTTFTLLLLE